jgi:hypothetical protein
LLLRLKTSCILPIIGEVEIVEGLIRHEVIGTLKELKKGMR